MNSEPIAYTYDADYHCPGCTERRFGPTMSGTDSEGNEVGAVAPWDEWQQFTGGDESLVCGTCLGVIETYFDLDAEWSDDDDDIETECRGEFEYRGFVLPCERSWHVNGAHENYTYAAPLTLTGHTPGGLFDDLKYSEGL